VKVGWGENVELMCKDKSEQYHRPLDGSAGRGKMKRRKAQQGATTTIPHNEVSSRDGTVGIGTSKCDVPSAMTDVPPKRHLRVFAYCKYSSIIKIVSPWNIIFGPVDRR